MTERLLQMMQTEPGGELYPRLKRCDLLSTKDENIWQFDEKKAEELTLGELASLTYYIVAGSWDEELDTSKEITKLSLYWYQIYNAALQDKRSGDFVVDYIQHSVFENIMGIREDGLEKLGEFCSRHTEIGFEDMADIAIRELGYLGGR
jgi:hypothetical protein